MTPHFDMNPPVLMDTPGVFFDMPEPAQAGGGRKRMIQLALRLTELTVAGLKSLATKIKDGLTNNASFPTPNPTPQNIDDAILAVTTAEGELGAAEALVTAKEDNLEQKVEALRDVLRRAGANCLDKVKEDPEATQRTKLLSANFTLKGDTAPPPVDTTPLTGFSVSHGDHSGEVDGICNKRTGAKMYRARHGTSPNGPWTTGYEGTKSSFTISDLPMGDTWFQMQAFVGGQWTEWCDPARLHVV
jgi:hypothetical protein